MESSAQAGDGLWSPRPGDAGEHSMVRAQSRQLQCWAQVLLAQRSPVLTPRSSSIASSGNFHQERFK